MSAHDHPGLADVADLPVAVALLQRVLSVHEIASCHFDLGSFDVVNVPLVDGTTKESAAGCGVCGLQVEGSSGEGRALPAATAAAARHFPRLERQLAHFGPASEQIPSFGGLPLRFIGAHIAKVRFRLEGPRDGFSGFEPSWARLMSTLRGRFQTTKGPDVALGTFVMSRCEDVICSYYLSPGRCRTSVRDQAHGEIPNTFWLRL